MPKDFKKVLIVDDEETLTWSMSKSLSKDKDKYEVTIANNGQELMTILEKETADMVFMDVQMPVLDGFEATVAIRAKERTTGTHIPIVAMTAHAMKGDSDRCLAAGMDGYISKPVQPKELYDAIDGMISGGW